MACHERQAIIYTNGDVLSTEQQETNFSYIQNPNITIFIQEKTFENIV